MSADPWIIVAALAAVASAGVALYVATRRHPPLDAQFATKDEVRSSEAKMEARMGKLEAHMHAQFERMDDKLDDKLATLDVKRSKQVAELHEAIRTQAAQTQNAIHDVNVKVERLIAIKEQERQNA